jgi:hypothetical protein
MAHCDRGLENDRPILYWHYPHAQRIPCRFFPEPGIACDTEVFFSAAVIMDILCEQWQRDDGMIEAHRGFVHMRDLQIRYSQRVGNPGTVTEHAIRRYIWLLHQQIKSAAADLGYDIELKLIENKPGVGYRIAACGLLIEDTFRRDPARC